MVTAGRRERGQLVLIAAVLVATAVLGTVVLLNAVHTTPSVSAQGDAQSVTDAERVAEQVRDGVHELFLASGADGPTERLPYVNDTAAFGSAVGNYSQAYTGLAATNTSAIVSVEYLEGESTSGNLTHQKIGEEDDGGAITNGDATILEDVDTMPRFYANVTREIDEDVTVALGGTDIEFDETGGNVSVTVDGESYGSFGGYAAVELWRGSGEIRGADGYNGSVAVDSIDGDIDVSDGNQTGWAFEISADGDCGGDIDGSHCQRAEDVDPTFELTYRDPSVSYDSEFTLYRRGDS